MSKDDCISHSQELPFEQIKQQTQQRLHEQGDKPPFTVARQLELLDELCDFAFGRFVLANRGINGFWTDYMLTHPWERRQTGVDLDGQPFTPLEDYLLNCAPIVKATQERFEIFLRENQTKVAPGAVLASIPCGMMGELLYLDYFDVPDITLVGIDIDSQSIDAARGLAATRGLTDQVELTQDDAWNMTETEEFDLISCNGLTIYESDDDRVQALYNKFYQALTPGGKLVTSFVTPPPTLTDQCEWDMNRIDPSDLALQTCLLRDIVQVGWQHYRSSEQTRQMLQRAGFEDIEIHPDQARLFPTAVAVKA